MKTLALTFAGLILSATSLSASAVETFVYRKPAVNAVCADANCALSEKVAIPGAPKPGGPDDPQLGPAKWSWLEQSSDTWRLRLENGTTIIQTSISDPSGTVAYITPSISGDVATFSWSDYQYDSGSFVRQIHAEGYSQQVIIDFKGGNGLTTNVDINY